MLVMCGDSLYGGSVGTGDDYPWAKWEYLGFMLGLKVASAKLEVVSAAVRNCREIFFVCERLLRSSSSGIY